MKTSRVRFGFALLFGLGMLALPAFMSSSAQASAPMAICSASDSSSPTGRQYAMVSVSSRDPTFCVRQKLGGVAPSGTPDCWTAASQASFPCTTIVDL